jgi:Mycobacterial cell wall arabinan synthesis protein/Arabinosyltransferase concanavalin like domain/EmbC C-terminal domain
VFREGRRIRLGVPNPHFIVPPLDSSRRVIPRRGVSLFCGASWRPLVRVGGRSVPKDHRALHNEIDTCRGDYRWGHQAPRATRYPPAVVAASRSKSTTAWQVRTLAGLAVLALASAIGVLIAPVIVNDPVVSWPRGGEQPRSTVLPLVPYRPLSLDARVPCAALAALDRRAEGGDALRTRPAPATPEEPDRVNQGLIVAVDLGTVEITASGVTLLREALPGTGCTYRVLADASGVRVLRDGVPQATTALRVPEVSELATDLEGQPAATGLAVSVHTDARYESTPTAPKIGLLVAHGAVLLLLLGLAWRWWGGRFGPGRWTRGLALGIGTDAALVAVSVSWVLLAPTNFDDPWYLLMARGAASSGSIGNAIYMFNVTENPFVASQYVLQAWGWLSQSVLGQSFESSWALSWMRLVPLSYGLLTWVLLRLLLVASAGRELVHGRAVWALLVAYLLWWLPYGLTLRPEPLIVLFAAATLLLAELARQRRSIGALAAATATAALAVSVSPSGLVAAAPLVLALPWLWAWLRTQDTMTRVAAVLLLAAASTSLVLVGFADATLGDFLESAAVHQWYYDTFAWYEELAHYKTVLTYMDSSQWARRAPVVLTLAVLAVIAVVAVRDRTGHGRDRRAGDDPVRRLLLRSAACSAVALALLAPTPTKWVNHFGAAAAASTVLLAVALLRSPLRWPVPMRRRADVITATAATAIMVGAVSLSFVGPNLWRPYSDRGQPFGDHLTAALESPDMASLRPALGPVQLANPVLWVAVALAAAGWVWWWRQRGRDTGMTPDRTVLQVGSAAIVVLTIVVFVWAPLRQYPGWSVALSVVRAVQGEPCSLASYAEVLVDTAAQPVPTGAAITTGAFTAAATEPPPVPLPAPHTVIWHDALPGGRKTGLLITPWFTLPAAGGTHLLVPLLGARTTQQLTLEYATNSAVPSSVTLPADRTVAWREWQQTAIPLKQFGQQRPSRVRLVIRDQVTSAGSWLAVGQPRLAEFRPLATIMAGQPVYADQVTATFLPCVDQVGVEHGIARAPEVLVLGDESFPRGFLDLMFEVRRGGTQVPADRSATIVRIPSRLTPTGPPTLAWGRVERVVYDHPVGLVDLRVETLRRAGWTRLPTLADNSYHGNL